MLQIKQIAIDSSILPIALYFEPEEIAASCIGLGSELFRESIPRFTNPTYKNQIKELNNRGSTNELTGKMILEKYFVNMSIAELNLGKNYLTMNEDEIKQETPLWFKFLNNTNVGN